MAALSPDGQRDKYCSLSLIREAFQARLMYRRPHVGSRISEPERGDLPRSPLVAEVPTAAALRGLAALEWCGTLVLVSHPPQTDDHRPDSALSPLRWVAEEEDLLYDPRSRTLHRQSCPIAHGSQRARTLPRGSALELVWAPRICDCGPDVTTALSHR